MKCQIELPDGSLKSFPSPPTGLQVAESISPGLAQKAVGLCINHQVEVFDLRSCLQDKDKVEVITIPSEKALEVIRHSAAHVMAQAVQNLWPEVKVTIGPVTEKGFYYDFDTQRAFTQEELLQIEQEMKSILSKKYPLEKELWGKSKALSYFGQRGESLKQEIIKELTDGEISIYRQGPWLDLCRGPHVQHLGQIGAIKVLSQSGAYWRGDPSRQQLKRIYGTAFHTEKQLKVFLKKREEAQKNDHRELGKKLDLFWFSPLSPGSPFFTPSGAEIYRRLKDFLREKYREYGYQEVISPQIFNAELFEKSGHLSHFAENMYPILEEDKEKLSCYLSLPKDEAIKKMAGEGLELIKFAVLKTLETNPQGIGPKDISNKTSLPRHLPHHLSNNDRLIQTVLDLLKGEGKVGNKERGKWKLSAKEDLKEASKVSSELFLKPMNCPGHCLFYKKDRKSYRDLPLRLADFGRLCRKEPPGSLHGLTRVKSFCQDDAHIFCRPDQLSEEIQSGIKMLREIYQTLGLEDYKIELSTRPEKRMGEDKMWDQAEGALEDSLKALKIPYQVQPGEGAFYGPKLDIIIRDTFDRAWQTGTFQCDFNLPRAFDLGYVNEKDRLEQPVMVHRAILGSIERFMGIYLEHQCGRLPAWLMPFPVIILPLSAGELDFSLKIKKKLEQREIFCKIDARNEKLSYKIRESQIQQIPYMLIIGKKENQSGRVSVRLRSGQQISNLKLEPFADTLYRELKSRSLNTFLLKKPEEDSH